jgi:hypothetical protein
LPVTINERTKTVRVRVNMSFDYEVDVLFGGEVKKGEDILFDVFDDWKYFLKSCLMEEEYETVSLSANILSTTEYRYKVGDKVKVVSYDSGVENLLGSVGEVIKFSALEIYPYKVRFAASGLEWEFDDCELELAEG